MAYGTFKSVEEIAEKFDVEVIKMGSFIDQKTLEVSEMLRSLVEEALRDDTNYVSEHAICETIISPILKIAVKNYSLKVWSHVTICNTFLIRLTGYLAKYHHHNFETTKYTIKSCPQKNDK